VNAHHLESLSLHLSDWKTADDFWFLDHSSIVEGGIRSNNFFASDIMGLQPNKSGLSFPSLQSLSLSHLSFTSAIYELSVAFNFSGLRKLKLWNCQGTFDLLDNIVDSQQVIRLDSLELVVDAREHTDLEEIPTSKFLQAFSGLRDLYLLLPILEWNVITNGVMGHLSTLKRLVLHARTIDMDDESDRFEEQMDGDVDWNKELARLLVRANCDMVGIGNPPAFMVSVPKTPDAPWHLLSRLTNSFSSTPT
jgi:hypothetical protein